MQDIATRSAAAEPASSPSVPSAAPAAASASRASLRSPELWRLNVLGPVELCYDTQPVDIGGLARDLLALLARTPGEEVPTAGIVANLWGTQPPEDAHNVVALQISKLRKALTVVAPEVDPTGVIVTTSTGYILHIGASNVDAESFERLLADGRRALAVGQPALAIARLDAGLRLWRGAAYSDFDDQPFARIEAQRLEDLRLAAIESRVEAQLAVTAPGVAPELLGEVQDLLVEHWHRERLWVHLMTAMFRLGRRGDALAALRQAEARLIDDLTIDPGPELRAAERAVLNNDSSLYGVALRTTSLPPALTATAPACVGREQEIDWLIAALDMAATRRAQARLIVGSPGIGKTRLVADVAQRITDRGIAIRYGRGDPDDSSSLRGALVVEHDRLNLIILDDLDLASTEDVHEVVRFIRSHVDRPVLTLPTCRDPVRVGELAALPKLLLTALGESAIADVVRVYAPNTTDAAAVAAMVNTGGVPSRLHRAASEWAFSRAGRRIDRAAASVAEPTRWLHAVRDEVVAGVLELDHVRRSARPLRPAARPISGCPYRGLARYEAGDAELFRGRERAVAEVVARLIDPPLLAIVGEAGTGKSSLVRAGVLPAIAGGVLPDSGRWRQIVVTPSGAAELALRLAEDPELEPEPEPDDVTQLAALADVADFEAPADFDPDFDEPADFDAAFDSRVAETFDEESAFDADGAAGRMGGGEARATGAAIDRAPRTLLVVDQFEEAFTLIPAARSELFSTIGEAVASGEVSVLLVLRSDAYVKLGERPELAQLVAANTYPLGPMSEDELRRAIEEPAALVGAAVEPDLVEALVAETATVGLPALSAGLATLWSQRTEGALRLSALRGGGGLGRAIEHMAERVYVTLPPNQREIAAQILVAAAEHGRTAASTSAGGDRATTLAVLREAGLVSIVDGSVELIHQSLLERWPRLRAWRAERRAERDLREHLSASAGDWHDAGRPAQQLYSGARLAAALDYAEEHDLSPTERDFLAAGQRVLMAADLRRRTQLSRLWYTIVVLALLLGTAIAAGVMVFIAWRGATMAGQQADAVRVAQTGQAEPDLRLALRLTTAAATVDSSSTTVDALRATLLRSPDLMATAGENVRAVAVSADGSTVAAGSASGAVWLLRAAGLSTLARLDYRGAVSGLAFTPDGHQLIGWGAAGVAVWTVSNGTANGTLDGATFGQPGTDGGVLADGDTLVLAEPGGAAVAWSLAARTPSTAYPFPTTASTVLVAPDGSAVAFAVGDNTVVVSVPSGHTSQLAGAGRPLALSSGGATLLTVSGLYDVASGARTPTVGPGATDALAAAWSPDSSAFATAGADGTITVYDARTHATRLTLIGDRLPVRTLRFGADGHTLYSSGDSGTLMAWDLTGTRGLGPTVSTLDTSHLVAQACLLAGRDLTPDEWAADIPGIPYRRVCP